MAFTPSTLSVILQTIGGVGMRFVSYRSDDAIATLTGTGYFASGTDYGLRLHDLIFVSPVSGSVEPYVLVVTAVDSGGNVTAEQTAFDAELTVLAGLDKSDGNFIVGNGTTWVAENGATARTSLGLGSAAVANLLDEDDMASNSATAVPSQQSAKAYVDARIKDFDTKASVEAATIPSAVNYVRTAGYNAVGDGGAGLYKRAVSEPSHNGKIQSTDGAWWELSTNKPIPQQFGAKGDGATDDAAAFASWLGYINSKTYRRYGEIPEGHYVLNSTVTGFTSGTVICGRNCLIDISGAGASVAAFLVDGTEGTRYSLTADATTGDTTVTLSGADLIASGIVAGDYVRLTSSAVFDSLRTNSRHGEQVRVKSINTGTGVVTFETKIVDSYATADSATISLMDGVSDVSFIGSGRIISNNNYGVSFHAGIRFSIALRPSVTGWSGQYLDDRFIEFRDCVGGRAFNIDCEDFISSGTGYGISVSCASQDCYIGGLTGRNVRHLFSTNNSNARPGIPRRIFVNGFNAEQSAYASGGSAGDAMDTHAASEDIHFSNGIIRGATGTGIIMEGRGGSISNVKIYDSLGSGIICGNYTDREADYVIENVRIYRPGNDGIRITPVSGAGAIRSVVMSNVVVQDPVAIAIYLLGNETEKIRSAVLDNIIARGVSNSSAALYIISAKGGSLTNINVPAYAVAGGYLLRLRNCEGMTVNGLTGDLAASATGAGLYIEQNGAGVSARIGVDCVSISSPSDVSGRGILVSNATTKVRIGPSCVFDGITTPISWGTGTGHRGGFLVGSATYDPPSLAAGAVQQTDVTVTGATVGDVVEVSFSVANADIRWSGEVSGTGNVKVTMENVGGTTRDLAEGTLRAMVCKIGT